MSSTFDLSFLFDKNGKIYFRGLLAAIPLPLFLLLAYNLGIVGLVVVGVMKPYYDIGIVWILYLLNWAILFYAGYRAAKFHNLGLISSLLSSFLCFAILTIVLYYADYYITTNDIGNLEERLSAAEYKYQMLPQIDMELIQLMYYQQPCDDAIGNNKLETTECNLRQSARFILFISIGSLLTLFSVYIGWASGRANIESGER